MKNIIRRAGTTTLAALALLLAWTAPASAQVDMTGTWSLQVDVQGQITNPSLELEQDGTTLTGTYDSPTLGIADVTGTVEGNTVTVNFEVNVGGQGGPVVYSGTVSEDGVWSGNFNLAGLATGTFTGTKQ